MDFGDWLRGSLKPSSGTMEEWEVWEQEARTKHPFRYWLVEDLPIQADRVLSLPSKLGSYLRSRFVYRTHALTSALERGHYYELDHRMLHCLFDTLKDFVECEVAWLHAISHKDKYKLPRFRVRRYRNPEAGLAHLDWECTLLDDDTQMLSSQALAAMEIKRLYFWWTDERPKRPEGTGDLKSIWELEERYEQEDTEMLIALIKLRRCLWT